MSVLRAPLEVSVHLGGYDQVLYDDVSQAIAGVAEITSWWRSVAHNAQVGGDVNSQHLVGWAIDVAPSSLAAQQALANNLQYGWVVLDEGDHLHVQIFPAGIATRWVQRYRA